MLAKRIIPCLDIKNGEVVKGTKFENITRMGNPIELASFYNANGADELVFYDITASSDNRSPFLECIQSVAKAISIPFTVGGGVRTLDDFTDLLRSGADKVSVNSHAFYNPGLIKDASERFGSQCVVVSVDVKKVDDRYVVFTHGGRQNTGMDALVWIKTAVSLGAGEVCVNAIDCDGVKKGYDIAFLKCLEKEIAVPIIASGGAGKAEDFVKLFQETRVTGALAASMFHTQQSSITEVKLALLSRGIPCRPFLKPHFKEPLLPVIVQDMDTLGILMQAYTNEDALEHTLNTGLAHFFSRSRGALWLKGETSGNVLRVHDIRMDCDGDCLLYIVSPKGPACHTGNASCFYPSLPKESVFNTLMTTILDRKSNPKEGSYTQYLFEKGIDKILKKIGEEASEVIIGAKNAPEELVYEASDLIYHLFVLLANEGISLADIEHELSRRMVKTT